MAFPKPSSLDDLFQSLKKYHNAKLGNQKSAHAMYRQDTTWARRLIPAHIPIFASSTPTELVDQIADQIRTDEPVIKFRPYAANEDARRHRVRMERWAGSLLEHDRENGEIDPYSQASKDLPLRGEAVLKRLHNPDIPSEPMLTDFQTKERFEHEHDIWESRVATMNPLLPARSIDPMNIFIPPNSAWPLPYIIEHQQRRQLDMWRDYAFFRAELEKKNRPKFGNGFRIIPGMGGLSKSQIEDPSREVQWLEFWSEDDYWVEVDGVTVLEKSNPYGIVPYCHAYSGYGRNDATGGSADKAISIIDKLRGELEGEIMARSMEFAAAQYYVFKRLLVPEGEGDRIADQMAAGSVIEYRANPDEIEWLDAPELSPTVAEFLRDVTSKIQSRVNPVQRGAPGRSLESGVQEAIALTQAGTGLADPTAAMGRLAGQSLEIAARQMKALNLSVTVSAGNNEDGSSREFIADAAKGDFDYPDHFEVDFKAFDPIEDTRRQQAGLRLMESGAMSVETFQTEYANSVIDDPEEENIRIGVERMRDAWYTSPEFQMWAVQQVMGENAVQQEPAEGAPSILDQTLGGGTPLAEGITRDLLSGVNPPANPIEQVNSVLSRASGMGQNALTGVGAPTQ